MRIRQQRNIRERPDGYQVAVSIRRKRRTRFFSLTAYGSQQAALEAAITWRDEQLAQAAEIRRQRGNNPSGSPGISLHTIDTPSGSYQVVHVTWCRNGIPGSTNISIDHHGSQARAIQVALQLRQDALAGLR